MVSNSEQSLSFPLQIITIAWVQKKQLGHQECASFSITWNKYPLFTKHT